MANPWFPSDSASAFSPPLDTAGDSRSSTPPLLPDPPDPSSPFPAPQFPPLSSSKPSRLSLRTAYLGPVDKTSGSSISSPAASSTAQASEPDVLVTDSRTTVPGSRSEITVAGLPVSENLNPTPLNLKPSSSTLSLAATTPSPPLIPDHPSNTIATSTPVPPTLSSGPLPTPQKATLNANHSLINANHACPQPSLVERLRQSNDKSLSRLAPVSLSDSGRPRILIPDSVFLEGAEMHKDFIICHFNGRSPPFNQIQSVLNHMWGKGKRVEIHNNPLSRSMLVRIPSDYLRQKILEKNVWYVGDSMFHASQWSSSSDNSTPREAIQIWAHLTGVPLDLRYKAGLSLVAGLIGEPKETDDFTLNLINLELSHVKVEVNLSEPLPRVVEFERQSGEVVEVQVDYPWVPPTCAHCKALGHISRNCLLLPAPPPRTSFQGSKAPKKTAPKAVSKEKIYVPVGVVPPTISPTTSAIPPISAAPPVATPFTSTGSDLTLLKTTAPVLDPPLPAPPSSPVIPPSLPSPSLPSDLSSTKETNAEPSSKNLHPLAPSPLIPESSSPLTLTFPDGCLLCNADPESRDHLFFSCPFSWNMWSLLATRCGLNPAQQWTDVTDQLQFFNSRNWRGRLILLTWQCCIYWIWQERNNRLHRHTFRSIEALLMLIDRQVRDRILSYREINPRLSSRMMQQWLA
ncbi:hypothetical protein Bca4012_063755 [Brassica carinata]